MAHCIIILTVKENKFKPERKINIMEKRYKTIATYKKNNARIVIEGVYTSKAAFIKDLRGNGYSVNANKVKTKEVFDYIINHTNCSPTDWKINRIAENLYWFTNEDGGIVLNDFHGTEKEAFKYAEGQASVLGQTIYINCGEDIIDIAYA